MRVGRLLKETWDCPATVTHNAYGAYGNGNTRQVVVACA